MDKNLRIKIYQILSLLYSKNLTIDEFELLNSFEFGESSRLWIKNSSFDEVLEACNIDYTTIFLLNAKPIETIVIDSKADVSVGLANPVMDFYFRHNYLLNLSQTHLQTPDHISIEFEFMAFLIQNNDLSSQREFLDRHLLSWCIAYLISSMNIASTPLYKDLFDFTIEFLIADFENLKALNG